LLYRRMRRPYIDSLGFPSGKMHLGDTLETAAQRELLEKCGYDLSDMKLAHRGMFNLLELDENGGLIHHIIGQVWYAKVTNKQVYTNHAGHTYWGDWTRENYSEFIPGFSEIIDRLKTKEFFVFELVKQN
jgi:8-oxo-dGTP pyrophosphatase MutT (NUDIX family)